MKRATIAISDEFLTAFAALPKAQQKKVQDFTEKFRSDPSMGSIHYEPLQGMLDSKVRSVRIGVDYRAIVIHPDEGSVYILVWVDHHDEAMAWAARKRFDIHPSTGALQMYEVRAGSPEPEPALARAKSGRTEEHEDVVPKGRLLAGARHDDLVILGVPELLLPSVRALRTEADLDELSSFLPSEARDALYGLAAGQTPDEVLQELDRARAKSKPSPVDFEAALQLPETQRHFKVVESERELTEILRAPLERWRIFLHPSQRKLVEWDVAGPVRVLGGAGTGKTVVAMHRARHLAKALDERPEARVLVTTYTRNLAKDIERSLKVLCGPELERIEVTNLHRWASQFLRGRNVRVDIIAQAEQRALLDEVASTHGKGQFSTAFLREEWELVVQAHDVLDREGYLAVSRRGRGTSLSRQQRLAVWTVFSEYRARLEARGKMEHADVVREARLHLEKHPRLLPYVAVIADEVQDFRIAELKLLRAIVEKGRNDLFVVGDAHQRIYKHQASLGECGIDVRGRSRRLKINYRTTEQIRRWAIGLLEGMSVDDLDGGQDTDAGYRSLREGLKPEVLAAATREAEVKSIVARIQAWMKDGMADEICIGARTSALLEDVYKPRLEAAGIKCQTITADDEGAGARDAVRLATLHRMKGLEFPRVILAGFNDGLMPLRLGPDQIVDSASAEDHERAERSLAYVAATRARDELVVTCSGTPSPWIQESKAAVSGGKRGRR